MAQRPSPTLANAVAPGVRIPHIEPLPRRIERNRLKFVGFMVTFTTVVALVLFSALLLVGFVAALVVVGATSQTMPDSLDGLWGRVLGLTFALSLGVTWAWTLARFARSEVWLVERLGARIAKPGALMSTKSVLRDMAIAAGLPAVPQLYVIDTPKVNAFVIGRTPERVRIGVTAGFLERITIDDQRAVFANLVSRVLSRDTLWATAVSALMGPIWAMRDHDLGFEPKHGSAPADQTFLPRADARVRAGGEQLPLTRDWRAEAFVFYGLAVIVTELLSWFHREAAWAAAEKADAEGMMLLKDPTSMLHAIESMLERDNHVPSAGDAYSQIFYCWAGFGFAPEDDPEMRRVSRMRETLGAEGVAYIPRPNVPDWPPPRAPRLEMLETCTDAPGPGEVG